jgi:ABC-type multidrug transport system fused ATPase/permease subunit
MSKLIKYLNINKKILNLNNFFYLKFALLFFSVSLLELIGFSLIGSLIGLFYENNIAGNDRAGINIVFQKNLSLEIVAIIVLIIFSLKGILYYYSNRSINYFVTNTLYTLRKSILNSIINTPPSMIDDRNRNKLINKFIRHCQIYCSSFLFYSLKSTSDILTILTLGALLIYYNPSITIFSILILLIIAFFYSKYLKNKILNISKSLANLHDNYLSWIHDFNNSLKETKIYNKINYFSKNINSKALSISKLDFNYRNLQLYPRIFIEISFVFLIVIILLLNKNQNVSSVFIEKTSVFFLVIIRILPIINQLINQINEINYSLVSVDEIQKNMNYKNNSNLEDDLKNLKQLEIKSFEVKNLSFSYNEKKLLQNLNFSFTKGELLGIFGPSGSGKTTLINLLMGFINPQEGKILINNQELKTITNEWQNSLAYIPQNVCIIKSTIKENIVFDNEESKRDEVRFNYSIEHSRLNDFVSNLENKYNTEVLEDGKNLSGGQKQRIAIARAIYHNKNILIMDEPTSFLDQDLINSFWEYVNEIKSNYSIILVSHDLNLKKICDKIIQL